MCMKKFFVLSLVLVAISLVEAKSQIIPTSLTLTVRDELGNTVEGARVKLFQKEKDYLEEANVCFEGVTDKKGVVKFKRLEPRSYFVIARKGDSNNAGGGEQTGKLEPGKFNKATVIINE